MKNHVKNNNMLLALPMQKEIRINHNFQNNNKNIDFLNKNFKPDGGYEGLLNLSQINCFVGTNNIGKSRFIKGVFKVFDIKGRIENDDINTMVNYIMPKYYQIINEFKFFLENYNSSPNYNLSPEEISLLSGRHSINLQRIDKNQDIAYLLSCLNLYIKYQAIINISSEYIRITVKSYYTHLIRIIYENSYRKYTSISAKRLYIPILRGARLIADSTDVYKNRTAKDYDLPEHQIFTGLSMYKDLQEHLLGSYEQRKLVKDFEDFLAQKFFNDEPVSLIPRMGKDAVFIKIGEKEHEIHNLGDGIQALIVILFPLFLKRKNEETWTVFIEEPEAHLHPKWQRLLLDTFEQEFSNFQFFITTHSNIFITHNPDVSVFRLYKEKNTNEVSIGHISEDKLTCLKDLGYAPSDVLQSNYIIWVEGPSDIPYIRYFMDRLQDNKSNKLKEGLDYTIMVYGGDNINSVAKETELNKLIPLINPNFTLILDSDKTIKNGKIQDDKKEKYDKLVEQLGIENIWRTEKREIENYVPLELFKQSIRVISNLPNDTDITFIDTNEDFGDRMAYTFKDSALYIKNPKFKTKELADKYKFDYKTGFLTKNTWSDKQKNDFIDMMESIFVTSLRSSGDKTKIANKVVELWYLSKDQYPIEQEVKKVLTGIIEKIRQFKN